MELVEQDRSVKLFVSYAHEDSAWMRRLAPLLKVRRFSQGLRSWHDQELKAGNPWDEEIRLHLNQSEIFLCLVSFNFLASDYIQQIELPIALQRHEKGDAVILPLLLYRMDLRDDCPSLARLNPLPAWGKAWNQFNPYSNALPLISEGLKGAVELVERRQQMSFL